jgi:Flp pilus assembly pilin Flp
MVPSYYWKNHKKGQGLVEYALILVLVAIIVLAVLLILGTSVGNVFTKINNSIQTSNDAQSTSAAPTAIPTWTTCATENGFCSFTGTAQVKYGAGSSWYTGIFTNGVLCSNSVFGDPDYGVVKSCQVYQ